MSNESGGARLDARAEQAPNVLVGKDTVPSDKHPEWNEDAVLELEDAFAVFDGVGGNKGGKEASRIARQAVKEALAMVAPNLSAEETVEELKKVLEEANAKIREQAEGDLEGMAATASLVKLVEGSRAVIANLGDSRVYVLRAATGALEQITLDDNLAFLSAGSDAEARALQSKFNNATDASEFSESEAQLFKDRNRILQALGGETIRPRTHIVDLSPGDKVMLSSDGIHDNLTDIEIAKILNNQAESAELAQQLSRAALERSREKSFRSKADDISTVVLEFRGTEVGAEENPSSTTENESPVERSPEDIEKDRERTMAAQVAGAQNLEDIRNILGQYETVKISDGTDFSAKQVIEAVDLLEQEIVTVASIPAYAGLRQRVTELQELEKVKERLGNQ